ncbi:hypothetical protein LZZ85_04065 [Terrimonas sp. NA20]|uniref:Uncharacterized protein n=1 Tax=Terrimonas ginsenosidimutans TaxID=2908004 RepID=A0ABS9KM84_9BACT|nr:hypothetical protein [Terrimonas ginsenosidimutans]MCG2613438.1 hypothetical protein [Terrimonas ginsenosidimutans]
MMRILFLLLIVLLISCNFKRSKNVTNDPFYTDTGGLDLPRIPFIDPYELKKTGDNEWRLELLTTDLGAYAVHNVQGINLIDGKILLYSTGTTIKQVRAGSAWIVIDPKLPKETVVFSQDKFLDTLHLLGMRNKILFAPDSIYDEFKKGHLQWRK